MLLYAALAEREGRHIDEPMVAFNEPFCQTKVARLQCWPMPIR